MTDLPAAAEVPALADPRLARIEAAMGGRTALIRQIHVWQNPALVYFNNPKVACSSIKATLNRAIAARAGQVLDFADMADIHRRAGNPMLSPRQAGFEALAGMLWPGGAARGAQVFTFVRDPVARFCSAYLSKLSPQKRASPQARRLWAALDLRPDQDLSLADFADLVARDPQVRAFDPHWRSQRSQIAYDAVPWRAIGWHADFARDFAAITAQLFGSALPVFDTRSAFDRVTASRQAAADLAPAIKARIEQAYAADIDMIADVRARGLFAEQVFAEQVFAADR